MVTKRRSRDDIEYLYEGEKYISHNSFNTDLINGALKPLDKYASDLEREWGVGKLQTLVSPETASKFEAAKIKLDAALLYEADINAIINKINVLMRGWTALEKEARSNGYKPLPPDAWYCSVADEDGMGDYTCIVVKDSCDASIIKKQGVQVYSLEEVARIIRLFNKKVDAADNIKKIFPDSKITKIKLTDDEIPF